MKESIQGHDVCRKGVDVVDGDENGCPGAELREEINHELRDLLEMDYIDVQIAEESLQAA